MVSGRAWRRATLLAGYGALTVAAVRCALIAGLQDHYVVTPDAADTCQHAEPPGRPTVDDGTADLTLSFATRSLDLGITNDAAAGPHGWDLDHVCTCPAPGLCAWRGPKPVCDDEAGRDNSFRGLFNLYSALSSGVFGQKTVDDSLSRGLFGLLLYVQHYNGGADDTQVVVSIFGSNGIGEAPDAATAPPDAAPPVPRWDGGDWWTVDGLTSIGTGPGVQAGLFSDANAYVAGHVLVANLSIAPGPFPFHIFANFTGVGPPSALKLPLAGMLVTATIVPDGSSYHLENGTIAGRFPTEQIPQLFNEIDNNSDSGTICPGSQTYGQVKQTLCYAADLPADPNASEAGACDGISLAVGFTAYPANIGNSTLRSVVSSCPDAGLESCQ